MHPCCSMGAWVAAALTAELHRRGGPLPEKIYASANRSPMLAGEGPGRWPWAARAAPRYRCPAAGQQQGQAGFESFPLTPPCRSHAPRRGLCGHAHPGAARLLGRHGGAVRAQPRPGMSSPDRCAAKLVQSLCKIHRVPVAASHELAAPLQEHPSVRSMLQPMLQADFRLLETWQPLQWPDIAAARGGEPGALQRLPCPVAALGATADRRYTPAQLEAWREVAPDGAFQLQWFQGGHL